MATQTDVQQLIQGLGPSAKNDGNPNTVYNVAPPSMDTQGNWFSSNYPTAASLGALQLPQLGGSQAWQPPAGAGNPNDFLNLLPTLPANGQLPGWGGIPPATPPLVTGGGTGPQGQGAVTGPATPKPKPGGAMNEGNTGQLGGLPEQGWTTGGGLKNPPGTIDGVTVRNQVAQWEQAGMPIDRGTGKLDASKMSDGQFGKFFNDVFSSNAFGEIVDFFIPGNVHDKDTGWDVSNAITGILGQMIPFMTIPFTNINVLDFAAGKLSDHLQKNPDGLVAKMLPKVVKDAIISHAEDQKAQKAAQEARKNGGSTGGGGGMGAPIGGVIGNNGLGAGWGSGWGGNVPAPMPDLFGEVGPTSPVIGNPVMEGEWPHAPDYEQGGGGGGGGGGMGGGDSGGGGSMGGGGKHTYDPSGARGAFLSRQR